MIIIQLPRTKSLTFYALAAHHIDGPAAVFASEAQDDLLSILVGFISLGCPDMRNSYPAMRTLHCHLATSLRRIRLQALPVLDLSGTWASSRDALIWVALGPYT